MKKSLIELLKQVHTEPVGSVGLAPSCTIMDHEFSLYHIKEVTFDEDSPRKEAFENVLNALSIDGITFTYLLMGDKEKVNFYFGIAKDKRYEKTLTLDVDEIGETILKPSLEGNFRGSVVEKLNKKQRTGIKQLLSSFTHAGKLEGVPSVNEENEEFQGVDRLVDIMSGDAFCLAIMADPLSLLEINEIERQLYQIYDKLHPLSKKNVQEGKNLSDTLGTTEGDNTSSTTGTNEGINHSTNTGKSDSACKGTSDGNSSGKSTNQNRTEGTTSGTSKGTSTGTSVSNTTGKSYTSNSSKQQGTSENNSREFSDKNVQEWLTYIDEVLLKRVKYGKNKGLYLSSIYLLSDSVGNVLKLGNTARAIFSGGEANKSPLTFKKVTDDHEIAAVTNFQFPMRKNSAVHAEPATTDSQKQFDLLLSKNPFNNYVCNWLSTNELSVVAGLPQKEVVGLTLKEEVEFGLNVNTHIADEHQLYLGNLVKSGLQQGIDVCLDKRDLDKHTFIAGVTGSGKTTTCHRLLESAQMPFLVIEPAKTEYRVLTKKNKDILIFTLGNDNIAPFRLNPFEFFSHENITSRVDMIKASLESAFDMEAAIPQLIEAAIYRCYEDKGWHIATSRNRRYDDPFADGVYAFPTLSDLLTMTETVVVEQGFDDRLKQDYIGSIKARLQGLLIGSKGLMLDTPRSINFKDLAQRNVILELEEIRNPSEKSLIMGFILANLNEAIRANYEAYRRRGERFRHITLIEEAHRLLSKFDPGDSKNKKQGVETFADMLAEVRKYGESLIIVDQIPNKLTPEVLKNTNTKIIHKLFAKDDKEAVGNTMALSDEQKDFLSNLETGRVILSSSGFSKPLQVQIKELVSTTNETDVDPQVIMARAFDFYAERYQSGLIQGLEHLTCQPTGKEVQAFLHGEVAQAWFDTVQQRTPHSTLVHFINAFGCAFMQSYILSACYSEGDEKDGVIQTETLRLYLQGLCDDPHLRIGLVASDAFRKNIKVNL
ncbi:helicase HerA domain-containing protein [Photobacterium nomapromontoriensis]|uniref:ATP-binding protein n=1 Tax=Photobacterium nomapromontoriensis TaxID=2910237 RepID=UPI003D14DC72